MIKTTDPAYFNFVLNSPEVRAGGEQDMDMTEAFLTGKVVGYIFDGGCIFYIKKDDGVFEAHTQALKKGRGKALRDFISQTLNDVFTSENAQSVTSFGAHENEPAKKLAAEFLNHDYSDENFEFFKLSRGEWLCRQH